MRNMTHSISEALQRLQIREAERDEYRRFYRGEHGVHLRTPEIRQIFRGRCGFSLNFCKTVIESLTDRVQVKAVNATVSMPDIEDVAQREEAEHEAAAAATKKAREIWTRSDLNITSLAWRYAVDGDVWIGLENGSTLRRMNADKVTPLDDESVFVLTSDDTGMIIRGAHITHYHLTELGEWVPAEADDQIIEYAITDANGEPVQTIIERIRNGDDDSEWGMSDLAVAIPQQRAINQRVIDVHSIAGNAAWPQRWIIGMNAAKQAAKLVSKPGAIHGINSTNEAPTDLKEFSAADPTKVADTLNDLVEYLSVTTGTPLQSGGVGANASAESRRIAQDKLTRRVMKALDEIGKALSRLLESALAIEGITAKVVIDWESPEPVSVKDALETALLKQSLGVSRHTLLAELGYDPDREEMLRNQERAEDQVALTRALTTGTDTPADLDDLLGSGA